MKLIELCIEIYCWIRIVISPLLIGSLLGITVYYFQRDTLGLVLGILLSILGLLVGLFWATRIWKKYGTANFLARAETGAGHTPSDEK